MKSWEKEKAYADRRAEEFARIMEEAISSGNKDKFLAAHRDSARYMKRTVRAEYYRRFLERNA